MALFKTLHFWKYSVSCHGFGSDSSYCRERRILWLQWSHSAGLLDLFRALQYRHKFEGPAEPDSNGRLPRIKAGSLSDGNLALFMEELWGDDGFSRGNFKKMGQLQSLRRRHLRVLSSTLRTSTMVSKRKKIPILLMNN